MKKAFLGMGLAASLLVGMAAQAAGTLVMKGTPVIDGKKDAIYGSTVAIPLKADNLVFAGSSKDWSAAEDPASDARGTSYLMYDDNNFYIFGEVTDDDVVKNEESTAPETNPWDNDAYENWIDLGDGVMKVSVSPFVNYVFGEGADLDFASLKYGVEKNAKGYNIEVAIPYTGLKEGGTIAYVLQLNDFGKDGLIRCYGFQKAGVEEFKLGGVAK